MPFPTEAFLNARKYQVEQESKPNPALQGLATGLGSGIMKGVERAQTQTDEEKKQRADLFKDFISKHVLFDESTQQPLDMQGLAKEYSNFTNGQPISENIKVKPITGQVETGFQYVLDEKGNAKKIEGVTSKDKVIKPFREIKDEKPGSLNALFETKRKTSAAVALAEKDGVNESDPKEYNRLLKLDMQAGDMYRDAGGRNPGESVVPRSNFAPAPGTQRTTAPQGTIQQTPPASNLETEIKKAFPDAFQENGKWKVMRNGKKQVINVE